MNDMNQLSNIMNIANLISSVVPNKPANTTHSQSRPMFPLDEQIHSEPLRICKCLIPYLPHERQKNLSIAVKVFELMAVVQYFSKPDIMNSSMMTRREESETWQRDLLQTLQANLDPNHAYVIDMFLKVNDIRKIMAAAQSTQSNSSTPINQQSATIPASSPAINTPNTSNVNHARDNPKEIIEKLSPLLDDNQKKMLEMFATIMK